jgi:hypothetical protein
MITLPVQRWHCTHTHPHIYRALWQSVQFTRIEWSAGGNTHGASIRYLGGNRDVCGVRGWGASSLALHHLPPVAFVWCSLVNRPTQTRG